MPERVRILLSSKECFNFLTDFVLTYSSKIFLIFQECSLSSIKHPLLGDTLYGGSKDKIKRVSLHSTSLKFYDYIENKNIEVNCDLPLDMSLLIK